MKNTKRMLIYITLTLTLLFSSVSVYAAKKMTVTITKSVTVKKKTLNIGAKRQLVVKKGKKVIKAAKLKFKTSNKKVVEVSKKGLLKAKKVGKATVTITYKKKRVKLNIKVIRPVKAVKLNKNTLNLSKGDKKTLTAAVSPKNATNKGVKWSSSNENVATVTNGVVTANENGTSVITATSSQGGKTGTCVVSVSSGTSSEGNTNTGVTTPASTAVGWASWKKGGVKLKNSGQIACYCTDDESSKGIKSKIAEAILTGDYTYNDIEWKIVGGDTDILDIEPYLWYLKGSGKKAGSCEVGVFIKGDPSGACQDKVTIVVESHLGPTPDPSVEENNVIIDGVTFNVDNFPKEYNLTGVEGSLAITSNIAIDDKDISYVINSGNIFKLPDNTNMMLFLLNYKNDTYKRVSYIVPSWGQMVGEVDFVIDKNKYINKYSFFIYPGIYLGQFDISVYYKEMLIKTCKVHTMCEKNTISKYFKETRLIERYAWDGSYSANEVYSNNAAGEYPITTASSAKDKLQAISYYVRTHYTYDEITCVGGAIIISFIAKDLGVNTRYGFNPDGAGGSDNSIKDYGITPNYGRGHIWVECDLDGDNSYKYIFEAQGKHSDMPNEKRPYASVVDNNMT